MLNDGDRGVVLQRGRQTYAITPHLPCGLVTPAMLMRIARVAERFGAMLKCTGAQRVAIIGLREEDIDAAWEMLGRPRPGRMSGNFIRSIRACPGSAHCKRGLQDALAVGLELDRRHNGRPLPGKMKIGVSGCANQCSETMIRDIGLIGGRGGWTIVVGGSGGMSPRIAKELTPKEVSTDQALAIVDRLIDFFDRNARGDERLASLVDRIGLGELRRQVS